MKILKIVSKLALVASAILIAISLIVAATSEYLLDAVFYTLFHTEILAVIGFSIGVFLMFTKNDITKKIGYGLTAVLMLFALINGTVVAKELDHDLSSAAPFLAIIAAIVYMVYYVLEFIVFILDKKHETFNPNDDSRIQLIKEWKALMDEGIITSEEFQEKRNQILGLDSKK